jgi:hypothetical protein
VKSKLIKCPQISHNLEVSFNDIKDFDKKFSKLSSVYRQDQEMEFTVNNIPNEFH